MVENPNQEFVFLIDRSGSMYNTIGLARDALQLFIQSLPLGCKFNVCSYGSNHTFMFEDSATYNDSTLEYATAQIAEFQANYGGTEIFTPLQVIFNQINSKSNKAEKTHIYLLTDGAVGNT